MLNPNRFTSVYDELISFYPDYYREIREMQAILRAQGALLDGIVEAIDVIIDNSFVTSATEDMIERLESFLEIVPYSSDLAERRQNVLSYFIGFGHVSATQIKALIRAFTKEDTSVSFNLKDNNDNYILELHIKKKHGVNPDWDVIYRLLDNRIPAHITTSRVLIYPAPELGLYVGMTIRSEETVGEVTVPDFDFSTIGVLTTPDEEWLRTPDGDILYYVL